MKRDALRGTVESTLTAIERGWLTVPEGIDFGEFLVSGGKAVAQPSVPARLLTLAQLFEEYFASLPDGSLEETTLDCLHIHERQLIRVFKKTFPIQQLTRADLQRFVDRRSKNKGRRGGKVKPITIRKAVNTLRAVWNWAVKGGLLTGRFPNSGVRYPKADEKPPFQTWKEIEQQIARGGLAFLDFANRNEDTALAPIRRKYEQCLQEFLTYRAIADLRRSWRIVLPNLEQCGLLAIEYSDLDEIAAADEFWSKAPLLSVLSHADRKDFIETILDFFRLEYAIHSENYLTRSRIEVSQKDFREQLRSPWTLDRNEELREPFFIRYDTLPRSARISTKSMGPAR